MKKGVLAINLAFFFFTSAHAQQSISADSLEAKVIQLNIVES